VALSSLSIAVIVWHLCGQFEISSFSKGSAYNIPVELWVQEDHPNSAPICYVKPTTDMYVSRNNDNVEPDGTIIIPYLRNWTSVDIFVLLKWENT
jgi:hypothetical protein